MDTILHSINCIDTTLCVNGIIPSVIVVYRVKNSIVNHRDDIAAIHGKESFIIGQCSTRSNSVCLYPFRVDNLKTGFFRITSSIPDKFNRSARTNLNGCSVIDKRIAQVLRCHRVGINLITILHDADGVPIPSVSVAISSVDAYLASLTTYFFEKGRQSGISRNINNVWIICTTIAPMVETEPPIRCGCKCGCVVGAILYDIHMSVIAVSEGDGVRIFLLNIVEKTPTAGSLIARNSTTGHMDGNIVNSIIKNTIT